MASAGARRARASSHRQRAIISPGGARSRGLVVNIPTHCTAHPSTDGADVVLVHKGHDPRMLLPRHTPAASAPARHGRARTCCSPASALEESAPSTGRTCRSRARHNLPRSDAFSARSRRSGHFARASDSQRGVRPTRAAQARGDRLEMCRRGCRHGAESSSVCEHGLREAHRLWIRRTRGTAVEAAVWARARVPQNRGSRAAPRAWLACRSRA